MTTNSDNKPQTWNSSYMLNIPMIDKQHMKFFKLFDNLLLLNKNEENYSELREVIDELEKYTYVHFNTEEALMRKAKSPDYEIHLIQHEIFIKKVEEFKTAFSYKNAVLLEQMVSFMRKWFLMHISEVDGKYVETVQEYMVEKGWEMEP